MILLVWSARLLWRISAASKRAGDSVYNACWRVEVHRAARREQQAAIERVIAESRTSSNRVGSPLHRGGR